MLAGLAYVLSSLVIRLTHRGSGFSNHHSMTERQQFFTHHGGKKHRAVVDKMLASLAPQQLACRLPGEASGLTTKRIDVTMIDNVNEQLFNETPSDTLYHYTSLDGLLGIINSRYLRASDVRFMNDSTELRHTLDLLRAYIERRLRSGSDHPDLLNTMIDWLPHRVVGAPLIFAASFRASGNLLSQWRGYSVHGKGISIGFAPEHIQACANQQGFQVGKCIYDSKEQTRLIELIVGGVESQALGRGATTDNDIRVVLTSIEEDLLRIAAMLKHPAFAEEEEWRVVSPRFTELDPIPLRFREGSSMLVPYYCFDLAGNQPLGVPLEHLFVGPTTYSDLSTTSIELFLKTQHSLPARGISTCDIPYRKR